MKRKWLGTFLSSFVVIMLMLMPPAQAGNVCFKCHKRANFKARVVHKPVSDGRCDVCHSPHVAKYKGLLREQTAALCYSCHRREAALFRKGVVHEPVYQGKCLSCHVPHASDQKGLIKKTLADDCFGCHKGMPRKFKHTHKPYSQGRCIVCHRPHHGDNQQLLTKGPDALCRSCHGEAALKRVHRDYPVPIGGCLSCHNPHGSNRRALIRNVLHSPYKKGCSGCHKGKSGIVTTEVCFGCHGPVKKEMLRTHSHLTSRTGNSCMNCHFPHTGDAKTLLRGNQGQICRTCHQGTFERYKESPSRHPDIDHCTSCHEPHGSRHLAMLKGNGNDVCIRCHEDQGKFTHPVGPNVLDPRTGQMVTCSTCHNPMGTRFKYQLIRDGKKDLCILCHQAY